MSATHNTILRAARPARLSLRSIQSRYSRPNSSSSTSHPSSAPTKDPSHPHLFYHPSPSGSLALSFLPRTPIQGSRTVLGQIPPGAAGPGDFVENREFVKVLHGAIQDGLGKGKGVGAEFEAAGRPGDGYIHITGMYTASL